MNKCWWILALVAILALEIGCTSHAPTYGCLYTDVDHHVYSNANGPLIGPGRALKRGQACHYRIYLLNYFFYGDPAGFRTLEDAMRSAGITKVASIDYSWQSVLYLFAAECIEVYGE
ncbi:MAG: hypothetical protein KDK39_13000 [Leptospiraceae bacterium]|nr:hypothetical protein [Leptospiraceae bacterium]